MYWAKKEPEREDGPDKEINITRILHHCVCVCIYLESSSSCCCCIYTHISTSFSKWKSQGNRLLPPYMMRCIGNWTWAPNHNRFSPLKNTKKKKSITTTAKESKVPKCDSINTHPRQLKWWILICFLDMRIDSPFSMLKSQKKGKRLEIRFRQYWVRG